jgi:hypothetical protein
MTVLPNVFAALPLEKLDLRWNPIAEYPSWLCELEQRGCTVFR